ncbi:MAG TPA: DUF4157 domain-containing protein, partial [Cytophagaceae bacterium]
MENSFGEDFSGVNIHTNSEQANQLNALAYTQGNDIHFAPGQYNPESKSGQELLGHELTHVVQQKQGRVNSTAQFKGVQINNDSALENEADEMGRKAAEGKDATVQLQAKDNAIQRYEIEGPWNKNEPIHEHITLYALIQAGIVNADTAYDDDKVWEFTRGAIWNDDPEGLLFDNNSEENKNWSSGVVWYNHFSDGKSKATKGQSIGVNDNLTARSHFGDLQFIHAMAVKEGVKASSTKSKIMMWSEFVYKTGIGVIKEDTLLKNVPVAGIPDLFPGKLGELTIRQLFHVHESGSTQKRCMGSLLHMIQDSYAEGHAERETVNNKKEDVVSFHSYTNQDSHKHGEKDGIQEGSKGTMREKIAKIPGANDAIDKCAMVLKMYHAAKPWEEVKPILEYQIFKLKNPDNLSSAGEDFEKDPKHVYESFKSWGTLDEESLGKKLSSLAIEKPQLVLDVLNKEVAYVDQDDVA